MSTLRPASWSYAEDFVPESDVVDAARRRGIELGAAEILTFLVFARGAHKLFRNIAKSMTGVSAITAFSSVIIGAVGVVMITVGGHSVMTGQMTLGDLFMYVFFTGLMAMPVIEIAAIGTQITEAFAGLDRIREILNMSTEDEEDARRDALDGVRGDVDERPQRKGTLAQAGVRNDQPGGVHRHPPDPQDI